MENENLSAALCDLVDAIRGVTLGSIENNVIEEAGKALISSWNDHNKNDLINVTDELYNWEHRHDNEQVSIRVVRGCCGHCACGESH